MKRKITLLLLLLLAVFNVSFAQDGTNDPTFNPEDISMGNGFNSGIFALRVLPDGKALYGGPFHKYRDTEMHYIIRLNADKSIDTSFNVGTNINGVVGEISVQSNGKIIIGGSFSQYGNQSAPRLARLNTDGSLDTSFSVSGATILSVLDMDLQADGKLLVAGLFSVNSSSNYLTLVRFNADGSLDTSFTAPSSYRAFSAVAVLSDGTIIASGAVSTLAHYKVIKLTSNGSVNPSFGSPNFNLPVLRIRPQPDGKVLVGGDFSAVNAYNETTGLVRLNTNGSNDTAFSAQISGNVHEMQLLPDGKILVGGKIYAIGHNGVQGLLKLNTDGRIDTTFHIAENSSYGNSIGYEIGIYNDIILFAGSFLYYDNTGCNNAVDLNMDGTVATGLITGGGVDGYVYSIANAGNGYMLVGGKFAHYNGVPKNSLALIDADGALQDTFDSGTGIDGAVTKIFKQSDGKYIIFGRFTTYNGVDRDRIARINADGSLDTSYVADVDFNTNYNAEHGCLLQGDGKLLVYGALNYDNNVILICRLNVDGTLDTTFTPLPAASVTSSTTTNPQMYSADLLPDGSIISRIENRWPTLTLIKLTSGGTPISSFTNSLIDEVFVNITSDKNGGFLVEQFGSVTQYRKMDANGVFDQNFQFRVQSVSSILYVQEDGKFFTYGNIPVNGWSYRQLIRYNANGTEDTTFERVLLDTGSMSGILYSQQDKLIISGVFMSVNGNNRNRIARIFSSGSLSAHKKTIKEQDVFAYKNNNALQVESVGQNIKEVKVYDLSGRLLSDTKNVNVLTIEINDVSLLNRILIVNVTLTDHTIVSKKIYY